MERSRWPILSLLLNAVLLGAVIVLVKRPPIKIESNNLSATTAAQNSSTSNLNKQSVPVRSLMATNANDGNWRDWLLQLRAAGVPDKTIAGLVASDFEGRWEKQRREMQKRYNKGDVDDDTMNALVAQHDEQQEAELRDALGADGFRKWDKDKMLADFDLEKMKLSPSETDAFYQLRKDLAQKEHDLARSHSSGEIDEADFDAQESAAQKDYDQKLKAMLGDDRYTAMRAPDDSLTGDLVRKLKNLNPSGTQFEAMLSAQKQWNNSRAALDKQLQDSKDEGKSYADQMRALDAARDAEYQRVLGTNGFDALKKVQDSSYQTLQRYASAWQLSNDDIEYVYRALQYSQKSIADYRQQAHTLEAQGQPVDWPKVEENINQFMQQTQQGLHSYLGDDRFGKLQKNSLFESAAE